VIAAAGRDRVRTERATAALAARLGHPVTAYDSVAELLASEPVDVLVIAAPVPAHLPALRAALSARVHVLCEKPLVAVEDSGAVAEIADGFLDADRALVENCQWPEVLPAFAALWPDTLSRTPRELAMSLSPVGRGRAMVEDSLSHFISVAQALAPVGRATTVRALDFEGAGPSTERVVVSLTLADPAFGELRGRLELNHVASQPRPAWLEIDGHRANRVVRGEEYAMFLVAPDGREVALDDPLGRLVYGFARLLRAPTHAELSAHARTIRQRARLYAEILAGWDGRDRASPT